MFEGILPTELEEKIYKLKHQYEFKKVLDGIKNKKKLKINDHYIITKKSLDFNNELVEKSQYAFIDDFYLENDNIIYSYSYGHFGFHEGCASRDQIRELNDEEKIYHNNNHFWKLPQEFYQS